jgi:NADH-quinone oxidoreductase subunit J
MSGTLIMFYLISALILGAGLFSVLSKNIFRSAIFLLFSLIGIAGLYFLLEVEFIAAVQIVVYVGGIVVLIIFSIFLTQQSGSKLPDTKLPRSLISLAAVVVGFILSWILISQHNFTPGSTSVLNADIKNIGTQMLSTSEYGYVLPFEVVSILLLAAMIGAIVIAIKTRPEEK